MIEKILDKPERHRRKVAFAATAIIGVVIFSAWLVIANFNIRQAFNPAKEGDTRLAQDFKNSLPSLRQNEQVTTELAKNQGAAAIQEQEEDGQKDEESKPFWKFW